MLRLLPLLALVSAEPPALPPASAAKVDFDRDVRPILAAHCVGCHGPDKQKGGFRLDDRKSLLDGGNGGAAVVVGKSAESRLIHAVAGVGADAKMPPGKNAPLTAAQVGVLRAWIDGGAPWAGGAVAAQASGPPRPTHWAFVRPTRPAVPGIAPNPIDAFILARLRRDGLTPNPEADRATLLRRVTFDLTGLPPTPDELAAFLADATPEAYLTVVNRLLASPHFGERWGRHWLDLARYADSDGYEKDTGRPFAWRYRDYVIRAFNADLPYDRFTVEQLAGDLLPAPTQEQRIATGFHRNTLTNKEGGADPEEFRVAACVDRVNTTATVWLGLTVGCAQCHDHKYDAISQREFYQLLAFFNSDREADIPAPLPGEEETLKPRRAAFDAEAAKLTAAVAEGKAKNLPAAELAKRQKAAADHAKKAPAPTPAMTLALGPPRPTHVMIRGDFLRKGVRVEPGHLSAVGGGAGATRLDLARWLVAAENPLTARVAVNWVWGKLFGRGLVGTPEDFGVQGERPTHPELLDWLACEFVAPAKGEAWSLKALIRTVVLSAAYKRSAAVTPELAARDPLNRLLARQSRLRLEAELVRDNALAVSGLLTRTVGGPSVRPPQPAGISELTYANSARWVESTGPDRYRRGLYTWYQRTSPYPQLTTFDAADGAVCTVKRERSNTPLQALTVLNDPVFVEAAQAFGKRILTETPGRSDAERVTHAVRLALGRAPTDAERTRLLRLLAEARPAAAARVVGAYQPAGVPPVDAAAWVLVARALLNLDEFVTRG
ncbi:PSD1 and planctomycete cytochrome C domain-containing protein [Urbifossiella limnaea]|uniref:Planctomycete cytochrome C n=1 Tax=Urbifossiella limnaea TaxID=2528023 RepID=A0A517XZY6_9BACT|nr:PSD1 and planctomycete cytochrome C domain-containing protein [Urbifossiella limnaea]QDU23074.1 Planctomycete cytochrome C [Urbifossiella limnaea]